MAMVDFISFSTDIIRAQIKGIDDSYRNPWDILAELAQNSVDAISVQKMHGAIHGEIEVTINSLERSVRFKDNGCGISANNLPILLNLFSSGKRDLFSTIGEKGVGLKFVLFQSSYFEIVTSDGETAARAIVRDANTWKTQTTEEMIKMDFEELPIESMPIPGTEIVVKGVQTSQEDIEEESTSFFKMTLSELLFLLRTKTALGNTARIWENSDEPMSITLNFTDSNGNTQSSSVENLYWLPIEGLPDRDLINLEDYEEWVRKTDRSDREKRHKLQGKILYLKGTYQHKSYREISYWVCMLPSRGMWNNLNERNQLAAKDELLDPNWIDNHQSVLFKEGIYVCTKGMPTGISLEAPRTGNAGYWSNCFMLFQDDSLKFDIGRKAIHGRIRSIYQDKARELFNKIATLMVKYTSARPAVIDTSVFDEYEIRRSVDKIIPLNSQFVKFEKSPAEQEASVSAVFFELLGGNYIDDIEPIYLGYRQRYDMYAYFITYDGKRRWGIYEFKSHLRNVLQDFSDARKMFDELNYIICWDVNDSDLQEMKNAGIECEPYEPSSLSEKDVPASVTHMLSIPNVNPIYVIDLKAYISILDDNNNTEM